MQIKIQNYFSPPGIHALSQSVLPSPQGKYHSDSYHHQLLLPICGHLKWTIQKELTGFFFFAQNDARFTCIVVCIYSFSYCCVVVH